MSSLNSLLPYPLSPDSLSRVQAIVERPDSENRATGRPGTAATPDFFAFFDFFARQMGTPARLCSRLNKIDGHECPAYQPDHAPVSRALFDLFEHPHPFVNRTRPLTAERNPPPFRHSTFVIFPTPFYHHSLLRPNHNVASNHANSAFQRRPNPAGAHISEKIQNIGAHELGSWSRQSPSGRSLVCEVARPSIGSSTNGARAIMDHRSRYDRSSCRHTFKQGHAA